MKKSLKRTRHLFGKVHGVFSNVIPISVGFSSRAYFPNLQRWALRFILSMPCAAFKWMELQQVISQQLLLSHKQLPTQAWVGWEIELATGRCLLLARLPQH